MGALLGVLIPFAAVPVTVTVNAAKGGATAYYRHGMPRAHLKALGETLDAGQAALVVLSERDLGETLALALRGADRRAPHRIEQAAGELAEELSATPAAPGPER